jgi:tetratricopeptide (TPR) repeat protein
LGKSYLDLGSHEQARRCLEAALRLVEDDGHEVGLAAVLGMLGRLEEQRGDLPAALGLFRRSLEIAQQAGDERHVMWTSTRLGGVLRVMEQHDQALLHLHEAQWLAKRVDDPSARATALLAIGLVHRDRGDLPSAAAHCGQALQVAETVPDLLVIAQASTALAEINSSRDVDAAVAFAQRAVALSRQVGNMAWEAHANDVYGDVWHANGGLVEAVAAWRQSVALYEQLGAPAKVAFVQAKLARVPDDSVQLPEARPDSPSPSTMDDRRECCD